MQKLWRIKDLLEWTTRYFADKGITESRLEAEVLLAHVLQKNRVYLYANYEEPVNPEEREIYRQCIKRRTAGEPTAYITGHKEFMSLDFIVNPAVLIPRPDTEILVEAAITLARQENLHRIIDVGTGSGAIAVSLAVYLHNAEIFASDISPQALEIARENAIKNKVCIHFLEGDILLPFLQPEANSEVPNWLSVEGNYEADMITANLPYIPFIEMKEIDRQVKDFEPHLALFAEGDGLDIYRRLIPQAYTLLRPEGILLLEIDARQANLVPAMMQGFADIKIIKDLAGRERVVQARRKKNA